MALEGKLKVLEGFVRDKIIVLPQDKPYVIGRERDCDMSVMSRRVSRRHAEISFRNGAFGIKDIDSKTGTYVNNTKVAGTVLRSGDIVQVGDIKFRFLFEEPAAQAPAAPARPAVSLPKPVVSPPPPRSGSPQTGPRDAQTRRPGDPGGAGLTPTHAGSGRGRPGPPTGSACAQTLHPLARTTARHASDRADGGRGSRLAPED